MLCIIEMFYRTFLRTSQMSHMATFQIRGSQCLVGSERSVKCVNCGSAIRLSGLIVYDKLSCKIGISLLWVSTINFVQERMTTVGVFQREE